MEDTHSDQSEKGTKCKLESSTVLIEQIEQVNKGLEKTDQHKAHCNCGYYCIGFSLSFSVCSC